MNVEISSFKKLSFFGLLLLSFSGQIDATMALGLGLTFSLLLGNPFTVESTSWSRKLLQISVVGLGFGLGIGGVLHNGQQSIGYTIVTIAFTMLAGIAVGKFFKVGANLSLLISFGTAICGGSAIAAMAPAIKAKQEDIAIALATIFTLNAIALLVFPVIGHWLQLDEQSFGLWAALAIHDTSSVVGAASAYGETALTVATTAKLTRALWIIPCVLILSFLKRSEGRIKIPFFILGLVAASALASLLPQFQELWQLISQISKQLLVVTLFLIGASISRTAIKQVGALPFAQGILLWLLISGSTLLAILSGVIRL